ncbi:MAG TPA: hypothetical protein VFS60_09550 [Thermoanaerobaculia bacterium]|nr:hypothetical protein [Thermoanaerobaculia bacterium]
MSKVFALAILVSVAATAALAADGGGGIRPQERRGHAHVTGPTAGPTVVPSRGTSALAPQPIIVSAKELDGELPADDHYAYAGTPGKPGSGLLLLMLHGRDGKPEVFRNFMSHAASLGYHVIGLSKASADFIVPPCRDPEAEEDCEGRFRTDVFDGSVTPAPPAPYEKEGDEKRVIDVAPAGSVRTRLTRLLLFLDAHRPDANWAQFFVRDSPAALVDWSHVVLASHSQGSGDVAYIAKHFLVRRVLIFSGTLDCDPGYCASWTRQPPFVTPIERWYAFSNKNEKNWDDAQEAWKALQLPGKDTSVDGSQRPRCSYCGAHRLYTAFGDDQEEAHRATLAAHSEPGAETPYRAVWTHLLTDGI